MASERREKRTAYEIAKTMHRAFHEIYYPVMSSGSKPALPITDEATTELARLATVVEETRVAWESSVRDRV